MFNLLPEKQKKEIKKQYRTRRFVITLAFFSLVVIAGLIFIIPSYILTNYKVKDIEVEISNVQEQLEEKNKDLLNEELDQLKEKIEQISERGERAQFHDLLQKALASKPKGVHVNGVLVKVESEGEDGFVYRVQLTGVSDARDDIVTYTDTLERTGLYGKVNIPIESLASQYDTNFDINLIISI
jgi:hypothetical protein